LKFGVLEAAAQRCVAVVAAYLEIQERIQEKQFKY
jgi:hypothetical protein